MHTFVKAYFSFQNHCGRKHLARHSWFYTKHSRSSICQDFCHQSAKTSGAQPSDCMSQAAQACALLVCWKKPEFPSSWQLLTSATGAVLQHNCLPPLLPIFWRNTVEHRPLALALQKGSDQNRLSTRLRKPYPINWTVLEFSPLDRILSHQGLELFTHLFPVCTFMQYIPYMKKG